MVLPAVSWFLIFPVRIWDLLANEGLRCHKGREEQEAANPNSNLYIAEDLDEISGPVKKTGQQDIPCHQSQEEYCENGAIRVNRVNQE